MKKLNCFYIITICALSACGMQAGQDGNVLSNFYSNWVRRINRPASEISLSEAMTAIGQAITSGYEKVQNMIEKMTPEYVRDVREGKIVPNIYNPSRLMGGTDISDFEVLEKALKGTYGPELRKIAEQKDNQLALGLAGQGLTEAAKAQAQTWSGRFNLATNWLSDKWSNYAQPGIESIGSASRYLVPTSVSQYAQTFPTVQKFTSLPRETQNFYLGAGAVAAPLVLAAALKAGQHGYKGAQNLYQWWSKPTIEHHKLKTESNNSKQQATAAQQPQQGWFSNIPRPSFSLLPSIPLPSWRPSWPSWPTWRSSEKAPQ